jgi:predicted porin
VTGSSDPNWNQLSLMLDYDLSARTPIYVQEAYRHADGKTAAATSITRQFKVPRVRRQVATR